jgi:inosine/xanthosine triphosphate pyrophosphatase family protein
MKEWVDYLENEEGKKVINNDHGLIAFYLNGKECHVTDYYASKEKKTEADAINLAREVKSMAKRCGCEYMTCNVFINESNRGSFAGKIKMFSWFGFLPMVANNNVITMRLDL